MRSATKRSQRTTSLVEVHGFFRFLGATVERLSARSGARRNYIRAHVGSLDDTRCRRTCRRRDGASHRGAGAGPRRQPERRPRDRAPARLSPARPDLVGRAAAATRPLEPPRALRHRGARPAPVGRKEARRVARVRVSDGGSADPQGVHAAHRPAARRPPSRVSPREHRLQPLRAQGAARARAAALPRDRDAREPERRRSATSGGARGRWG